MTWRQTGHQEAGPFQAQDLKICDLCGSLNLAVNKECFVCGWRGKFDRRPEVVQIAMELMIQRQGKLELQNLTSPLVYHHSTCGTFWGRMRYITGRIFHWFFG
jgi:hypothetical protein